MPLGFLLIRSNNGEEGGLAEYLAEFLTYFKVNWKLDARVTHTDKNWSEINACRRVFPTSKHQLCFWHALRAVKTHLSTLQRAPAHYNADAARRQFFFIDKTFVPIGQVDDPSLVKQIIFYFSSFAC